MTRLPLSNPISPSAGAPPMGAPAIDTTPLDTPPLDTAPEPGWRRRGTHPSLSEVHASVRVPLASAPFWRKLLAFTGPGLLVAVGYMDPGNWATDIAGGASFGYALLSVILLSNLMAILLQYLAIKLGVVTGRDLAQACRDHYSRPVAIVLWVLCEIAIAACDLAEVIGSAIALNLLFGLPLWIGITITALDVLLILMLQHRGFRYIEAIVATLMVTIFGCFAWQMVVSRPDLFGIAAGFVPTPKIVTDWSMLYVAVGILGATVMPHNLYLHSSIVQTRAYPRDDAGRKYAVRFATIDSTVSLLLAFFINAAILILAAAAFHNTPHQNVAGISEAYQLLSPVLGVSAASTLFAVALLASGQNATLTGTLAGQIVMEGFINLRLPAWLRRLTTRLIAIIPAVAVSIYAGEQGIEKLLVLSQVILSLQLSFAVVPLVLFTSDKAKMGAFANGPVVVLTAWIVTTVIVLLNAYLLINTLRGWLS